MTSQVIPPDLIEDGEGGEISAAAPITGAEGAETLIGQAGIVLKQPTPGEVVRIVSELGHRYTVYFDPADAQVMVVGDDFVLAFANGGQIVIEGLWALASRPDAPSFEIAGLEISSGALFDQGLVQSAGGDGSAFSTAIETAAAPPGAEGTGATQYTDDTGETIELLEAQDTISPVELEFSSLDIPVVDLAVVEEEPLFPPVANDDLDMVFLGDATTGNVLTGIDTDLPPNDGILAADDPGSSGPLEIISVSSDLETKGTADANSSGVITLDSLLMGNLEIDLNTGEYTYVSGNVPGSPLDVFVYAIENADGLTDSASLTIEIKSDFDQ